MSQVILLLISYCHERWQQTCHRCLLTTWYLRRGAIHARAGLVTLLGEVASDLSRTAQLSFHQEQKFHSLQVEEISINFLKWIKNKTNKRNMRGKPRRKKKTPHTQENETIRHFAAGAPHCNAMLFIEDTLRKRCRDRKHAGIVHTYPRGSVLLFKHQVYPRQWFKYQAYLCK